MTVDYVELMKGLEQLVDGLETRDALESIQEIAGRAVARFRQELGLTGGRIYQREADEFVLRATFPEAEEVPPGIRVSSSYPPIEEVLESRAIYMQPGDESLDPELEAQLGAGVFAAIDVGAEGPDFLLAFDVERERPRANLLYSLGILRHAINSELRRGHFEGTLREARLIQASILPRKTPRYSPFTLAARTEPMEIVGGDFYDFIRISDKVLGLAIADVSGHGFPAALQVRDIHMGLRMGLSRDLKIIRVVERLNTIIHHSTLTSRFVSMFYGELELNGNFIYVNAGHPAPFHLAADGSLRELVEGGAVLGPIREATYERGFVRMQPGDMLALYSDGIVEAAAPGPEAGEFGTERLLETVQEHRELGPAEIVDEIFSKVSAFGGGSPPADDRTVMIVKHEG